MIGIVVYFIQEDLIDFFLWYFVFLAHFEGLGQQIPHKLHEFVDAMVVNEGPLLMEVRDESSEKGDTVLFGKLD